MEFKPQKVERGFLLAVSAPSGTGKTSLCDRLRDELSFIRRSISATTRPKREGEVNGKDYEFLSLEEFKTREKKNGFIETAEVFSHWYGTPKAPVDETVQAGKVLVMDIDTEGALNIRRLYKEDAVLLFILPPSIQELENRLRSRGKDSPDVLKKRLAEAMREIAQASEYDYIVRNDNFDEAYSQLKAIVFAERLKARRLSALL